MLCINQTETGADFESFLKMGKNQKNPTYEDFLLPEHQDALNKSANARICMPIHFSNMDLRHLFQSSAQNLAKMLQKSPAEQIDINDLPMDDTLREAFTDPHKQVLPVRLDENHLTRAFCLMGAASNLGRVVECYATEPDSNWQFKDTGNLPGGIINPLLFDHFASDPLAGAQALFGEISDQMHNPGRLVAIGFISPNLLAN